MTPDPEAIRNLLRAARPSGKDDDDPEIRAAREAADDALRAELEEERGFDDAVARDFRSNGPPPDLEERLIAAMRAARAEDLRQPVVVTRRSWLGWAAAASVAGAAGTAWWLVGRGTSYDDLVARLAAISKAGITLSLMSMDRQEVGEWLAQAGAPRPDGLPAALDALPRKGCHLYDIEGRPVSLECFLLPDMRQLHLFATATRGLRGAPAETGLEVTTVAGLTSGAWSRDGRTMVLLSEETPATIEDLLGSV
jgi:hypothetical protein